MRIERCGSVARERHSPRLRQETASCRVGVSVRAQRGGTPVHQTRRREILLELTSLGVLGSTVASTVGPIVASMVALPTPAAQADEAASVVATGGRVGFLEISVDRKPFGRIEIEVFSDPNVKIGEQRFLDLCEEIQGVGYKRGKINRLLDSHIQGGALTNLSYRAGRADGHHRRSDRRIAGGGAGPVHEKARRGRAGVAERAAEEGYGDEGHVEGDRRGSLST